PFATGVEDCLIAEQRRGRSLVNDRSWSESHMPGRDLGPTRSIFRGTLHAVDHKHLGGCSVGGEFEAELLLYGSKEARRSVGIVSGRRDVHAQCGELRLVESP